MALSPIEQRVKFVFEEKGLDAERVAHSIRNISLTKDSINFYVIKSMKKLVKFKKTETGFFGINYEMSNSDLLSNLQVRNIHKELP